MPAPPDPRPSSPGPAPSAPLTALVLAGRRGPEEPVAAAARVSHKALVSAAGVPMLLRVVRSLRAARSVGRIVISIDDPSALEGIEELAGPGAVELHPSLDSPSASVLDCFERLGPDAPLLLTTADHALLTSEMIDHFCAAAEAKGGDLVLAVVEASTLRARFPEARRTFIPLRGDRVTGANLFALRTPEAARAVAFWRRAEQLRKQPWRLIAVFGLPMLVQFALRRLDLEAALRRASKVMGARIEGVRMPFAECAIDVDRPADLALAEQILAERSARN